MKISKQKLKEIIKEEIRNQVPHDKWDPYRFVPMSQQEMFKEIEAASRILEALPLEDLPEIVTTAAQNLRKALEITPPEEELAPTRKDIDSYLR